MCVHTAHLIMRMHTIMLNLVRAPAHQHFSVRCQNLVCAHLHTNIFPWRQNLVRAPAHQYFSAWYQNLAHALAHQCFFVQCQNLVHAPANVFPRDDFFTYHKAFTAHHAFLVCPLAHIHFYVQQFLVNSTAEIEDFSNFSPILP
jgi:hypothetical protein